MNSNSRNKTAADQRTRTFFRLPRMAFARSLAFGAARFVDPDTLTSELDVALRREPTTDSMRAAHQAVSEALLEWDNDAALEVSTFSGREPDTRTSSETYAHKRTRQKLARTTIERIASDATSLLRFAARPHIRVNVDIHRFGRTGEHALGRRDNVVLFEQDGPIAAPGWSNVGGWPEFTFDEGIISAIESDTAIMWLGSLIRGDVGSHTDSERRAMRAVTLIDRGFRSQDPDQRVLMSAIAVEVLFSRPDVLANKSQTMAIARRVSYLSCAAGCGRLVPHCVYTAESKYSKKLLDDLVALAEAGEEWRCSTFLHITAPNTVVPHLRTQPLFTARNSIAHEGGLNLDERALTRLVHVADQAVRAGLGWLAQNPGASMIDLDNEMATDVLANPGTPSDDTDSRETSDLP